MSESLRPGALLRMIRARLGRVLPPAVWLLLAVQAVYAKELLDSGNPLENPSPMANALGVVFAFLPSLAVVYGLELAFGKARRARIATLLPALLLIILANALLVSGEGKADAAFIWENVHDLRDKAAFEMVLSLVAGSTRVTFVVELVCLGLVLWLPSAGRTRPAWMERKAPSWGIEVVLLASAAIAWAGILPSFDAVVLLGRSTYHAFAPIVAMDRARAHDPRPYPLVHDSQTHPLTGVTLKAGERPNVIVVLMESFNALYSNRNAKDGNPYTPNMDGELTKGLSVEHFYGNSVQTCRGHFATLCSLIPSFRGKEHTFDPLDLECLPHVLARHGYKTFFYTGAYDPNFEDQIAFARRMGIRVAECADAAHRSPADKNFVWGWGLADDHFYPWAFNRLEKAGGLRGDVPFFLVLAPVENHYPFDEEPGSLPLHGEPTEAGRVFAASLRTSDRRMQRLFDVLAERGLNDNTIIVYTGDHGFPSGEHDYDWNETGAYEENFRVPFVVQWPGHITPRVLTERAASQLDIAPTLLDLLQIGDRVPFEGRSLFDPDTTVPFVPLVQPYDGIYVGSVEWPYKSITRLSTGETQVYDLARDPHEHRALAPAYIPPLVVDHAKSAIERIYFNQSLFGTNSFWDKK